MFTYELARRLAATSVTANAVHPGMVSTDFGAEDPGGIQRVLVPLIRPLMKTPAQGAATSIHVASAASLGSVTGKYFADCTTTPSAKRSYQESTMAQLWQVSVGLVSL